MSQNVIAQLSQIGTPFHDVDVAELESRDLKNLVDNVSYKKRLAIQTALNPESSEYVRDEQNRRRFHGAFTGGFSAGYFNTVGSEEGFRPAHFVSSRKTRAITNEQKLRDYIDEEDIRELKGDDKLLRIAGEAHGPLRNSKALVSGRDLFRDTIDAYVSVAANIDTMGGQS